MKSQKIDTRAPTEGAPAASRRPEARDVHRLQLERGTRVIGGRFEIIERLGEGGMGAVYKAHDRTLEKQVALKFRHVRQGETPEASARHRLMFLNEASKAQEITHPHVCRIFDVHEEADYEVISMEFIDGEDLARLLRRVDRLTPSRAVELGLEMCQGLEAIHQQGLFHQDLKPHNVMIDREGRAKISDLGLAGSRFLGVTPRYTAPEQLAQHRVSVQSDLYALGLVLYEMLTGNYAFANSCLQDPAPPPPRTVVPEIDPEVERVVLRCMSKAPEKRPKSATEVATILTSVLSRTAGHTKGRELKRRALRLIAWILVSGSLISSMAILMNTQSTPSEIATPLATTRHRVWKDGSRLVPVPGGEYRLGADELGEDSPSHRVHLSPYWIAAEPVTNEQFSAFLKANPGLPEPRYWKDISFHSPLQPLVGVTWAEARAYCQWAGLELPSEAQWEAAARGAGERERYPYPWGEQEPTLSRAHFGWAERGEPGQPEFVGSLPEGAGPYGTLDQAGNVWEWCLDAWNSGAYNNRDGILDPIEHSETPGDRVVRGGSWKSSAAHLHVAYRAKQEAERQNSEVGFRCVLKID